MIKSFYKGAVVCALMVLSGCASLVEKMQPPTATIKSVKVMPGQGLNPRFVIGLHVVNPNGVTLPLRGVDYDVMLAGQSVVTGHNENLASIPANGEQDVEIEAVANLMNGLSLANALLANPLQQEVNYQVKASLDVGRFFPNIPLSKAGTVNLTTGALK